MKTVSGVEKKESIIIYKGVKTHNLKNLNLKIPVGSFLGVAGPSGSGKSSLIYSTIYAIAEYEWAKVTNNPKSLNSNVNIETYKGVIPSVALKQENSNINPRSTISTFLRIDKYFKLLLASVNNVSPSLFTFNNPKNSCKVCEGIGSISSINLNDIIDWEKSISQKPFSLWKKDYEQKLLEKFAFSKGISITTPLNKLLKEEIESLLNDDNGDKFTISYIISGRRRSKAFKYIGLLKEVALLQNNKTHISKAKKITNLGTTKKCPSCNGGRFSIEISGYKYNDKSLNDIYLMEISDLKLFIEKCISLEKNKTSKNWLTNIGIVIEALLDANLEYLNLNRGIPSLSGGELQRIRLVNILTSQINNIMYIIDEPSAKLHVSEYDSIISDFKKITQKGNTILMVEHNPYFLNKTDSIIFIGPGSGDKGGYLLGKKEDLFKCNYKYSPRKTNEFIDIEKITENNIHNLNIRIPLNRITGIYGPSGSGKSTLVKNIKKNIEKSEYISQKTIRGSKSSTIASYSELLSSIRDVYGNSSRMTPSSFSFLSKKGGCNLCKGRGVITYELDFGKTKVDIVCDDCKGKRFSNEILKYKVKEKSIFEVLNSTIDNLIEINFFDNNLNIHKKLINLQNLGLGYLTLFRTTDTLSGGEAQRLKLMKFINKKINDKIFIFDEPFKGLDNKNIIKMITFFEDIVKKRGTVIFIEHNVLGLDFCDYLIEMGPGKGKNGGKVIFNGEISSFKESDRWNIYNSKIN